MTIILYLNVDYLRVDFSSITFYYNERKVSIWFTVHYSRFRIQRIVQYSGYYSKYDMQRLVHYSGYYSKYDLQRLIHYSGYY